MSIYCPALGLELTTFWITSLLPLPLDQGSRLGKCLDVNEL